MQSLTIPSGTVAFSFPARRNCDFWQLEFQRTRIDLSRQGVNRPRVSVFHRFLDRYAPFISRLLTVFHRFYRFRETAESSRR
jgi:hypothetical protein